MESVVPKGAASGIAGSDAFADRCWLAWHALPRRENGKPPSWRSLELANGLPDGTLSKIFKGDRKQHALSTYQRIAAALRVDVVWLVYGQGTPPAVVGALPPRDAPADRGDIERAVASFQRNLQRAGVPAKDVKSAIGAAAVALQRALPDGAPEEDIARSAAVDFAHANGLHVAAIERAVAMPAPTSWTAEQWYTRIKSLAAEMG